MNIGQTHNRPAIKHEAYARLHKMNTEILRREVYGSNRPYSDTGSLRGTAGRYRAHSQETGSNIGLAYKARPRAKLSFGFYLSSGIKFAVIVAFTLGALMIF